MKLLQPIKKICPVALLLVYFLELQNGFGQGDVNMTDSLKQRFQSYCKLVPREEVFVSSDREEYISGEVLWFSTWLVDRQSSSTSSESKICYLELLNFENIPVIQKRILLEKGFGKGQFELPDTLSTGTYTIRAYTNWMKNFLPTNCFIKDIKIYNAFKARSYMNKTYIGDKLVSNTNTDSSKIETNMLLTVKINYLNPDTLGILVTTDNKFRSVNNDIFYLFIQTHGKINYAGSEKISDRQTKINIPNNLLIPGINQITIFDSKGRPVCERYTYTPYSANQLLSVHSADSFPPRSKVSLDISIKDNLSVDFNLTDLSVSVAPVSDRGRGMELNDYMIFGSEYGQLPESTIKGRRMNELPQELIDSILRNIKSNWTDWKLILSDNQPEFRFPIEKEDHFLSGVLLTKDDQLAYPGEYLILSTPGKVASFQYSTTNYEAGFSFNIPIVEEVRDLVIQAEDTTKNYDIYISPSFAEKYIPSKCWIDSTSVSIPQYISDWSINYQVGKIYGASSLGASLSNLSLAKQQSKRFYGKPDAEILLKDWAKLTTMEEVFFEIVPHFKLKKKGSDYEMLLSDPFGNILYGSQPVMMIDGVVIKDPAIIANLNPDHVEKIDVVKGQYMVGDYLFNGVVNVFTKSGDFSSIPVPDYAIRMQYRIFDSSADFLSPDYSVLESKNSTEPDFRNTLYWNPSVKPGTDGKARVEFWTSDIHSDYEINIQGITSDGKVLSIRKTIKVR